MTDEITIRPAEGVSDYRACQEAQRLAWGLADESYVVPIATMVGAQLHGGLVLGAFLPDGRAVGVSFAFLGKVRGRHCLYSQLTGLVPGYQDRGLGTQLKLAQRDFALKEGVPVIAWAFDPLQAGNARFNLDKLGAVARHFVADMYGARTDALNLATPTDRLIVEWETSPSPRPPNDPAELRRAPALIESGETPRLAPGPIPDYCRLLRLEVPGSIAALRADHPALAAAWQSAVREAFPAAFAAGFEAVGFTRTSDGVRTRSEYLLRRP